MNERKKLKLENELMQNLGMIRLSRNPHKYIQKSKNLLSKLEKIWDDPFIYRMHKKALEDRINDVNNI